MKNGVFPCFSIVMLNYQRVRHDDDHIDSCENDKNSKASRIMDSIQAKNM
jgi:hypothetical protein